MLSFDHRQYKRTYLYYQSQNTSLDVWSVSRHNNDPSHGFIVLKSQTPTIWFDKAIEELPTILLDHAWCERKAAQSALGLLNQTDDPRIQLRLSRIVREEMRHFELLMPWLKAYHVTWRFLEPPRYGKTLFLARRSKSTDRICDTCVIASLIEARSCERFKGLTERIADENLARFYHKLMIAEQRHADVYMDIALQWGIDEKELAGSLERISLIESEIIHQPEAVLRFHSGLPK